MTTIYELLAELYMVRGILVNGRNRVEHESPLHVLQKDMEEAIRLIDIALEIVIEEEKQRKGFSKTPIIR